MGDFVNCLKHGFGTFKWKDGATYTGNYVNDIKEGHGVFTWPNGS